MQFTILVSSYSNEIADITCCSQLSTIKVKISDNFQVIGGLPATQ